MSIFTRYKVICVEPNLRVTTFRVLVFTLAGTLSFTLANPIFGQDKAAKAKNKEKPKTESVKAKTADKASDNKEKAKAEKPKQDKPKPAKTSTGDLPNPAEYRKKVRFKDPYKNLTINPLPAPKSTIVEAPQKIEDKTNNKINRLSTPEIDKLIEAYKNLNSNTGSQGYRVQVYVGAEADAAQNRILFLELYPGYDVYSIYDRPNFKIRVGNFKKRAEADEFLAKVKTHFRQAFVLPDEIEIKKD